MNIKSIPTLLILSIVVAGCRAPTSTPYQPLVNNEGYNDRKLSKSEFEIQIRGNYLTTYPTLVNHFQRRAQELCGHRKPECKIAQENTTNIVDGQLNGQSYTPTTVASLPYITGTVKCCD